MKPEPEPEPEPERTREPQAICLNQSLTHKAGSVGQKSGRAMGTAVRNSESISISPSSFQTEFLVI